MNHVYDSDDERRRLSRPDPDQLDFDGRPANEWPDLVSSAVDVDALANHRPRFADDDYEEDDRW